MTLKSLHPALLLAACIMLSGGCGSGGSGGSGSSPDVDILPDTSVEITETDVVVDSFDDHTVHEFESAEALLAWAKNDQLPAQAKYIITDFSTEDAGVVHWLDMDFYRLHDEWFWFTLLNGQEIPGLAVEPIDAGPFATIAEVYEAFPPETEDLPLGLKYYGERLYSPGFYHLGLYEDPRFFGLGSVLHYPPNPERVAPDELWLFELEFTDKDVDEAVLAVFFQRLGESLPPEVEAQLKWLVRSVEQEVLAEKIRAGGGPFADRILTYEDLVVAGEVVGYNEGITAGRIARFTKDALGVSLMEPDQIVILEAVPDDLPPVAGIVTAVPQTPLAHINLLAQSRGTPNVYVAGVMDLDWLEDFENWGSKAILKVSEGGVQWKGISKQDYATWLALKGGGSMEVPVADLTEAPLTLDLTQGSLDEVPTMIALCGGKAAAMMAFQDFPEIPIPDSPLAITVRAYAEHMEPLAATIEALMDESLFKQELEVRFLVLEGEEDFLEEHAGVPAAAPWAAEFIASNGDNVLGEVIAAGGFKRMIRDQPVATETLAALEEVLGAQFGHLGLTQGLRFRSSSTAEDVEGFNGAGLYDSNTGYLHPELQTTEKLQKRSVEWALKKTWASYWAFGAYEERRHALIDHMAGRMGVLVHPRFDDPQELANGVITLSLAHLPTGTVTEMVVNVQDAALSVTNPDPDHPAVPEIDQVKAAGNETPVVTHVQPSSEVATGVQILSEDELLWLFEQLKPLASAWLNQANADQTEAQSRLSVILDMEFKRMAEGWPATLTGDPQPERLVLKQVRTLDQALRVPYDIAALPAPRDILEVVGHVQRRTCTAGPFNLVTTEIYTDPASSQLLPYDLVPFNASVSLQLGEGIPELALVAGTSIYVMHTQTTTLEHPHMTGEDSWDLHVILSPEIAENALLTEIAIDADGSWTLSHGDAVAQGDGLVCDVEDLLVGPSLFLEQLLEP